MYCSSSRSKSTMSTMTHLRKHSNLSRTHRRCRSQFARQDASMEARKRVQVGLRGLFAQLPYNSSCLCTLSKALRERKLTSLLHAAEDANFGNKGKRWIRQGGESTRAIPAVSLCVLHNDEKKQDIVNPNALAIPRQQVHYPFRVMYLKIKQSKQIRNIMHLRIFLRIRLVIHGVLSR